MNGPNVMSSLHAASLTHCLTELVRISKQYFMRKSVDVGPDTVIDSGKGIVQPDVPVCLLLDIPLSDFLT